jgi:Carboxypeptidase regulatory-like domain
VSCLAPITLVLGMVMSARLPAQVVGGTILGTITEPSGAVIPDAQVSIKNLATNVIRTTVTNKEGFYTVPSLWGLRLGLRVY